MKIGFILFLALVVMAFGAGQKSVKKMQFDGPQQIYSSGIRGQTLTFNYSKYATPQATEIQLVIFIIVGDDSKGKQLGWIKTSNAKDFHYSVVWGNHESTYFSWYGDTFLLKTTPDQMLTIQVGLSLGGANNGFNVYFSGYWVNRLEDELKEESIEKINEQVPAKDSNNLRNE